MPSKGRKYPVSYGTLRVRRMRGKGKFLDFLKKAGSFLKKHKIISRGLKGVAPMLGPKFGPLAGAAGGVAGQLGLGKRGGALRLAGARRGYGLRLAGGRIGRSHA